MRLNVFIAKSGYCSRRKAGVLIKEGKVRVKGKIIIEPFFDTSGLDKVEIGKTIISLKEHIYILFNKPKGVTTTLSDRFAKRKIIDFFPKELSGIYPVGRLDKDSSGLLILTNDGDLCYKLTHPKFRVEKEYLARLKGKFEAVDCQKAVKGLRDEGDYLKVDKIKVLKKEKDETLCAVIVCEGKKRHLRRLFKGLGFEVKSLVRVRIGKLVLGSLKPGRYKILGSGLRI